MSNKVLAFIFWNIAFFVGTVDNKETIVDQQKNDKNDKSIQDDSHDINHHEFKTFDDAFLDLLSTVGEAAKMIEKKFPNAQVKWNELQEEGIAMHNKSIEWQKRVDEWAMEHLKDLANKSEEYVSLMHQAAEAVREERDKWLENVEQWKKSVLKAIEVRDQQGEEEEDKKETQREIEFLEYETLNGGGNSYEVKEY